MQTRDLFIASDAALRQVVDRLTPADLERPVPADWSNGKAATLHDILAMHARDEAWVPDVLAGTTIEQVGTRFDGDLLGADPIASYAELNEQAEEAALGLALDVDSPVLVHFTYGDFPVAEGFVHLAIYRAFQAWQIANLLGMDFSLSDDVIDGMNEHVTPNVEQWRGMGVFPPAQTIPDGADAETVLLCATGFWAPAGEPSSPIA